MVRFLILAHAVKFGELCEFTDNVRQLEGLAKHGFITETEAANLKKAYLTFRDIGHKQVLQGDKALIDVDSVADLREKVQGVWDRVMI